MSQPVVTAIVQSSVTWQATLGIYDMSNMSVPGYVMPGIWITGTSLRERVKAMTDKELGKAMDKARKRHTRRILAAQAKCNAAVKAADAAFEQELDSLLGHTHPVLSREDG